MLEEKRNLTTEEKEDVDVYRLVSMIQIDAGTAELLLMSMEGDSTLTTQVPINMWAQMVTGAQKENLPVLGGYLGWSKKNETIVGLLTHEE